MIEIKRFNRTSLWQFVNSDEFRKMPAIPISSHRALSQVNNPRADADDILLVVSYDGNKMTGYLGVLPDKLYLEKEIRKVGWLSCFWVDESYRSTPVSAALLMEVMDAWNRNILLTNFVPSLLQLYKRTGLFQKEMTLEGLRGYMRLNLTEILPFKNAFFRKIKFALKIIDSLFNAFADLRFFRQSVSIDKSLYEYSDHFDNDLKIIIDSINRDNYCRRGIGELQWIIDYPWILEKDSAGEKRKYYFSLVRSRFIGKIARIKDNSGKVTGCVFFCVRDNNITVPYLFSNDFDTIAAILIKEMVELKCNMVTIFQEQLAASMRRNKWPFLFTKKIKRPYLISKKISFADHLKFQDGDGDCAFY